MAECAGLRRFTAAPSISGAPEPPADGWYRTPEDVVCYVHEGRPFSLRCGERLLVGPLDTLAEEALAVSDDDVTALQQAGAELIEAFCATGGGE